MGGMRRARPTAVGVAVLTVLGFATREASGACPNLCSGHGDCNIYSRCDCWDEWTGGDCSERICPFGVAWADDATGDDEAHAEAECSNRGVCARSSGECSCMAGFGGKACHRTECTSDCNDVGRCLTLMKYADDYYDTDSVQYTYDEMWDSEKIMGCVCDYPYVNYDCSERECPTGDDPLTTGQVNEQQLFYCTATGGSFAFLYLGEYTDTIKAKAGEVAIADALMTHPRISTVSVSFSITNGTACQTDAVNIVTIEFEQNFGDLSPLVPYTDDLSTGGTITMSTDGSTALTDSDGTSYVSVTGDKENDDCSGRGLCIASDGTCSCYDTNSDTYYSSDGYGNTGTRGDCGYPATTTSTCPGDVACSAHGVCDDNDDDATYSCSCSDGYMGGDCAQRECPYGLAWFWYPSEDEVTHTEMVECSNGGTCDRSTGMCACGDAYYGAACDYMMCGGGTTNACNGHGQCMSMSELALNADDNGDETDYEYGTDPNDASTWDASRIYGCKCDYGWTGYDCSEMECPLGDDPGTYGQYNELQLMQCTANAGNFKLSFRQEETKTIAYNASAEVVERKLEELFGIYDLTVTYSYGNEFCITDDTDDATLNVVQIQFITEHGDLPKITVDDSNLVDSNTDTKLVDFYIKADGQTISQDSATEFTSIMGTTESEYCSNRGLCDRATGLCACFTGYYSSDGQGNHGAIGDCGYQGPYKTVAT